MTRKLEAATRIREAGRRLDQILQEIPRTDRAALQARVDRIGQQVVKASPLRGMDLCGGQYAQP